MCKSVGSLHVADTKLLDTLADDTRSDMPPTDARRHRSAVARVVYMAQDRPDLDVAACTLAKTVVHPKIGGEWLVKRVCRYIKGWPRFARSCEYQGEAQELVVQTGRDWASCKSTRRSNSGGWAFRGRRLVHHWCRVQARVALSTGEAELFAQIQGLQVLLSLKYLMEELRPAECRTLKCVAEVDSTACKGVHASSRSWSTQAVGNANNVGPTNSSTGRRRSSTDLTCRDFCRLFCVSQLVSRSLSSTRSNGWNVAWREGGRLCWFFLKFSCTQRDESEVPVPLKVPILVSLQGTQVSTQWWLDI